MNFPTKPCVKCDVPIHWRVKSGLCRACSVRTCGDCGKVLSKQNKVGYCQIHASKRLWDRPGMREAHKAGLRRAWADPRYRAANRRALREISRKCHQDEAFLQRKRERWWAHYHNVLNTPEVRARNAKAVAAAAGKMTETKMAWCPPEYRDWYRHMNRTKRIPKADCMKIIADQVLADKKKMLAGMSPFERQELALKNGARLVANDTGPQFGEGVDYGEARWELGRVG